MGSQRIAYLDYAASAPQRPEAARAELCYAESRIAGANPNSLHTLGREAARALDGARSTIARCLGGGFRPSDVTFTSGGTESNNLAVYGLAEGAHHRDRHRTEVVISAIEHDSVTDLAPSLRDRGFEVRVARSGRDGVVTADEVASLVGERTALVSVMYANNETGVVQPVPQISRVARAVGALMHTDAVQAFGRIPMDLSDVDAASLAAHKVGGPVGVGALALRGRVPFRPQAFGGGQELGRRPGTQDVRGALAFAAAAQVCLAHLDEWRTVTAARAQALYDRLCAEGTGVIPTTSATVGGDRLPGIVSVVVPSLDSETLVLALDAAGFAVSAGSACSSGSLGPSHVLSAMGVPRNLALGSLRVSFDERVDPKDLEGLAEALLAIVRDRSVGRVGRSASTSHQRRGHD